jgi:lipopolysaccharide/colanic/teichoic acid biosynthesis glycosyltransferase
VFGSALLLPDWYRICIRLAAGGRLRAESRDRVAVLGSDDEVDQLEAELAALPERPASVVARMRPEDAALSAPDRETFAEWLVAADPTIVVLDRAALETPVVVDQVSLLHARGVRVRTITMFYEEWLGKLPMGELERASLLFDIGEIHRTRYSRAKRIVDLPLGLAAFVALVVAVPFVQVGNLIANRGPLLYRQARVGKNGAEFTIVKFRTMRSAPDGGRPNEWTTEDDPRITRFGRVLRRTHLDELPQAINILRGDLSVVGPRPEQPHYVEELTEKLPFYPLRHLARPGLTGWAQVNYGYAGDERDALEKLQYDFWYLRHQGLLLDLRVIGRTVRSVIGSRGAGR